MATLLLLLLLAALLCGYWYSSLAARELATRLAAEICRHEGLQLLDGTAALQRLEPHRDARGRLRLRRTYRFDYSRDGATRQSGFIIMSGTTVETVGFASHRAQGHAR